MNIFHPNTLNEIYVDFVWMPPTYLASGILSPKTISSSISLFLTILRNNCCIYIPAHDLVFRSIILNWMQGGKLAERFIFRFIRLEQAKHGIILVRTTSTLPLHKLGKDGLRNHLFQSHLSRSDADALIHKCNPSLNNLLDWWPPGEVLFLSLSKIDQSKFVERFDGLSSTNQLQAMLPRGFAIECRYF